MSFWLETHEMDWFLCFFTQKSMLCSAGFPETVSLQIRKSNVILLTILHFTKNEFAMVEESDSICVKEKKLAFWEPVM